MGPATERKRHAGFAIAPWVAVTIVVALAGTAVAGGGDPPRGAAPANDAAAEHLQVLKGELMKARRANLPGAQRRSIGDAKRAKVEFVLSIYKDATQRLFGCDSQTSRALFFKLEFVDIDVEMAARGSAGRKGKRLANAAAFAQEAAEVVAACPDAHEGSRTIAREIESRAENLNIQHLGDSLGERELKKAIARIASLKRSLLADQLIYDCDAFSLLRLVEEIDLPLEEALEESERNRRDRLIDKSLRSANELIEFWKGVPCATECSDKMDNDGDDLHDADDLGCQTGRGGAYDRSDRSEQDHEVKSLNCATLPTNPVNVFVSQPNAGKRMVGHILRNATDGQVLIERTSQESDFTVGGPVALGTAVCGPGTSATVEWARQGLSMSWHLEVSKDDSGVTPEAKRIVAAANTR